ncbi:hypothetical protein F5884DRAFT_852390 [Xylogone sp. PMI_703]|nr:hypothetical protein F5884DRAFT_852390 [Xylogone sp. PMI_703]
MSLWSRLPRETRLEIFEAIVRNNSDTNKRLVTNNKSGLSRYAAVCKEWQVFFEKKIYCHLTLEPSCLGEFGKFIHRQRCLVEHIYFVVEIGTYPCSVCKSPKMDSGVSDHDIVARAITELFLILNTWSGSQDNLPEGLVLELNIYSPSDSKHAFKGDLHLDGNSVAEDSNSNVSRRYDLLHGWYQGRRINPPLMEDITRLLKIMCPKFQQGLPIVESVKGLVVRRQTRRSFSSMALQEILKSLTKLEYINYEPWQELVYFRRCVQDRGYCDIMLTSLPETLKTLILFEEFNEDYNIVHCTEDFTIGWPHPPELVKTPCLSISVALAWRSTRLEKLFASYIVDAEDFFKVCRPHWAWSNLTSLALTSRLLVGTTQPSKINSLLVSAGTVAINMPRLQIMELWNGVKGNAYVFRYQVTASFATLSWCGTWDLELESQVVDIWQRVSVLHTGYELSVQVSQRLNKRDISSHAAAIQRLKLNKQVIHPISLGQIEREAKLRFYQ